MGAPFAGIIIPDPEDGFHLWHGKRPAWPGAGYGGTSVCEGVTGQMSQTRLTTKLRPGWDSRSMLAGASAEASPTLS